MGAVGDPGGGEHDVAMGQIIEIIFPVEIVTPHLAARARSSLVAEHEASLHLPADEPRATAAASTPSGAPPEPTYMSTPESGCDGRDHAADVAVGDQP